ncbi:MAG TPA: IS1634 family transposase [Terriglobales bacterium]|nr:IS1634 family transposase [Terriglobales bacterium]
MFVRTQTNGSRTYLLIVDNEWVDGKVKQRVLLRLGRLDELLATGRLDSLIQSLGRFSEKLAVLGAHARGDSITTRSARIGPALIFQRLWQACSIDKVLTTLLQGRRFEFSVERAIFLTVLHRLLAPGSDRAAEKWKDDYAIEGVADLDLHHLYRAMAWLGEALPQAQQDGATPFAPRTNKDLIEEALFARRRDLFSDLDLVFFDTTSIYFEGAGGETLGQRGHSKDHRPDLKQMVVGLVLDQNGDPVCSELWPGNTADVKSLVPIVERLKSRFGIGSVCIVADRGMISAETLAEVEKREWKYILGVRMRSSNEAKAVVARAGRYAEVHPKSDDRNDPSPLQVKEVWVEDARRYVVCVNVDQATKDAHDRQAVVASLRDALGKGDKSLVGNKGYRKYLRAGGKQFAVDEDKIQEEARYDGKWVLTTNTDLPAREVALKYKQLWMVEEVFRSMKSLLDTRPIYHKCDETIRGHVFCSFLALLLRKELEDRLARKERKLEWADIIRDLDNLIEMEVAIGGKGYVFRGQASGGAGKVFQACGVALPPALRPC